MRPKTIDPVVDQAAKVIKKTNADKSDGFGYDSDSSQGEKTLIDGSKKIKKFNRNDYKDHKLIALGYPQCKTLTAQCKKKYSILVTFRDREGRTKTRQVLFGSADQKDFVDHQDEDKRIATCKKLTTNDENWAHPNYYRLYLLNSIHPTIGEAHTALLKHVGLDIDSQRKSLLDIPPAV